MEKISKNVRRSKRAAKKLRIQIADHCDFASIYGQFVLPAAEESQRIENASLNNTLNTMASIFQQFQTSSVQILTSQIDKLNIESDKIETLDLKIRDLLIDCARANSPDEKIFENLLDGLPQLVTEWLQPAKSLEAMALQIAKITQESISGMERLRRNIEEWEAALNPRYDMDGEMLAIHEKAVADTKAGRTHRGLPTIAED